MDNFNIGDFIIDLEYNLTRYLDGNNIYDNQGNRINGYLEDMFYNKDIIDIVNPLEVLEAVDYGRLLTLIYYWTK